MTTTARITAEALLAMNGDQRYERVNGELRTAPAGFEHGAVIGLLMHHLTTAVVPRRQGVLLGAETGFRLRRNPDTVRAADIAFVRMGRVPSPPPRGYWEEAPDLAVAIVSPGDSAEEIEAKVEDYLSAGSAHVWVVHPRSRKVHVHYADGRTIVLGPDETLTAEGMIDGFSCTVSELFL